MFVARYCTVSSRSRRWSPSLVAVEAAVYKANQFVALNSIVRRKNQEIVEFWPGALSPIEVKFSKLSPKLLY